MSFALVVIARQNVTDLMQKHKIPKSKCDKTLAKLASGANAPVVLKEFGTWSLSEYDERSSLGSIPSIGSHAGFVPGLAAAVLLAATSGDLL